jgi:hypothetical protein
VLLAVQNSPLLLKNKNFTNQKGFRTPKSASLAVMRPSKVVAAEAAMADVVVAEVAMVAVAVVAVAADMVHLVKCMMRFAPPVMPKRKCLFSQTALNPFTAENATKHPTRLGAWCGQK